MAESSADDVHYPGTYLHGVYNRITTEVAGRPVENESLVNLPNWLPVRFRLEDGPWITTESCDVLDHHVELDLRRGLLTRRTRFRDASGRVLCVAQRRFVSLRDMHLAAIETCFSVEGSPARLVVQSGLDGTVENSGVERYRSLGGRHLDHLVACQAGAETVCLEVETKDSHVRIALSARTRVHLDGEPVEIPARTVSDGAYIALEHELEIEPGQEYVFDKVVSLFTSRDPGIYEPHLESEEWAANVAGDFEELLERHVVSWSHVWDRARLDMVGGDHTTRVLNLHIFHLLQTVSKNTAEIDAGVPARGLHGEAYRGHIFWDELFIFPFLSWRLPERTRALLRYRSRRLDAARRNASSAGHAGAMYPWQSGSNGREETQTLHLNPESGRWLPDASHLQRHINSAIAYNIWQYYQVTADREFMNFWGAEMLLEIARFWSSATTYNHSLDRYEIKGVMGPDEYHEAYPWSEEPGLDNNAYTNVFAVWVLLRAFDVLELLPPLRGVEIREKLGITEEELDRWGDITRKMRVCFHDDDIISQFEGYERLEDLDWVDYAERYGNIQRLDRILEAEGRSPNDFKLTKQADVLMLFYLFTAEELEDLLGRLGYEYTPDLIPRNIAYYEQRTSHGSTLSQMVHAWLHSRLDRERSWDLFREALLADVADVQGGTTAEGIHLGAMAGTVDLVQRCYTGLEARENRLHLNPSLPEELECLQFSVWYRGHMVQIHIDQEIARLYVEFDGKEPIVVEVKGLIQELKPGETLEVPLT